VRAIPGVLDARIPEELGGWWLLVRAAKKKPGDGERMIKALGALPSEAPEPAPASSPAHPLTRSPAQSSLPRWIIVVGPDADLSNPDDALFHWVANLSPTRDRSLSLCGRRVAFDATPKLPGDERNGEPVRDWPPIIRMSKDMQDQVARRWGEFGL
jgi:3-polyprenyl-4-hydroxybenzoate decarboxylase